MVNISNVFQPDETNASETAAPDGSTIVDLAGNEIGEEDAAREADAEGGNGGIAEGGGGLLSTPIDEPHDGTADFG